MCLLIDSYVEAPTPNVMVFRNGAFGRQLGLDDVKGQDPNLIGLVKLV